MHINKLNDIIAKSNYYIVFVYDKSLSVREGGFLRIIGGKYKGILLSSLNGEDTRPTLDRVKEGIFSAIQFELQNKNVLDLFSGSGQMALESLSRGASYALMCDANIKACSVINENIERIGAVNCEVVNSDFVRFIEALKDKPKFDIVFIDPPFKEDYTEKSLELLRTNDILSENALVIIEKSFHNSIPEYNGYNIRKIYKYGKIQVIILNCNKNI